MTAQLKRLHSPDVDDLRTYRPEVSDNFGFLLQAMIGPKGLDDEESFDILVCTPRWLIDRHDGSDILLGRHYLIVFEYNYDYLAKTISSFCDECSGQNWRQIAVRLGRLGKWEFEDYQPTPQL